MAIPLEDTFNFAFCDYARWSEFLLTCYRPEVPEEQQLVSLSLCCKIPSPTAPDGIERVAVDDISLTESNFAAFRELLEVSGALPDDNIKAVIKSPPYSAFFNLLPRVDLSLGNEHAAALLGAMSPESIRRCYSSIRCLISRINEFAFPTRANLSCLRVKIDFEDIFFVLNRVNAIYPLHRMYYSTSERKVHMVITIYMQKENPSEDPCCAFRLLSTLAGRDQLQISGDQQDQVQDVGKPCNNCSISVPCRRQLRLELDPGSVSRNPLFSRFNPLTGITLKTTETSTGGSEIQSPPWSRRQAVIGRRRTACPDTPATVVDAHANFGCNDLRADWQAWLAAGDLSKPVFSLCEPFSRCGLQS